MTEKADKLLLQLAKNDEDTFISAIKGIKEKRKVEIFKKLCVTDCLSAIKKMWHIIEYPSAAIHYHDNLLFNEIIIFGQKNVLEWVYNNDDADDYIISDDTLEKVYYNPVFYSDQISWLIDEFKISPQRFDKFIRKSFGSFQMKLCEKLFAKGYKLPFDLVNDSSAYEIKEWFNDMKNKGYVEINVEAEKKKEREKIMTELNKLIELIKKMESK